MTIGTGIFASTILIVLVLALWQTTRHHKWKSVGKVAAVLVGIATIVGVGLWQFEKYEGRPQVQEILEGVELGMTAVEVKISKGPPTKDALKAEGEGYPSMVYRSGEETLLVMFTKGAPSKVEAICMSAPSMDVNGISGWMGERMVLEKLGRPASSSIKADGLSKMLSFPTWNMAVEISSGKVESICVTSWEELNYRDEFSEPKNASLAETK